MSVRKKWVKVPIVNVDNIEFLESDEEGGVGTVEYYQPKPRKRLCKKCSKELPAHLEPWMTYHPMCYDRMVNKKKYK